MNRSGGNTMRVTVTGLWMLSLMLSGGCATLVHGTYQKVRVRTQPSMGTVRYNGHDVYDGHRVTVSKGFYAPYFSMSDGRSSTQVNMKYHLDPLLLGDAALLLVGVVPGVVALGVDFATGSWRYLEEVQTVEVSGPTITPAAFRAPYLWPPSGG